MTSDREGRPNRLNTMFRRFVAPRQRHRKRWAGHNFCQLNDHTLKDVGLHRWQIDSVFGCID